MNELVEKLRNLADRIDKATRAPWTAAKMGDSILYGEVVTDTPTSRDAAREVLVVETFDKSEHHTRKQKRDFQAICAARNEAPRLLREAADLLAAPSSTSQEPQGWSYDMEAAPHRRSLYLTVETYEGARVVEGVRGERHSEGEFYLAGSSSLPVIAYAWMPKPEQTRPEVAPPPPQDTSETEAANGL